MNNIKDIYSTSLNVMLYILNKANKQLDFHKIFKIMYFAEQKHLAKYGRMITDDSYIRMPKGPVPSYAYNIFQTIRDNNLIFDFNNKFKITGRYNVISIAEYDKDELSKSDVKCIDESFDENINLSFDELTKKSHDEAWEKAFHSDVINIYQMARVGGANDEMIQYIKHIQKLKKSSTFENEC